MIASETWPSNLFPGSAFLTMLRKVEWSPCNSFEFYSHLPGSNQQHQNWYGSSVSASALAATRELQAVRQPVGLDENGMGEALLWKARNSWTVKSNKIKAIRNYLFPPKIKIWFWRSEKAQAAHLPKTNRTHFSRIWIRRCFPSSPPKKAENTANKAINLKVTLTKK